MKYIIGECKFNDKGDAIGIIDLSKAYPNNMRSYIKMIESNINEHGLDWLRNKLPEVTFKYKYDKCSERYSAEINKSFHIAVSMYRITIYKDGNIIKDLEIAETHDQESETKLIKVFDFDLLKSEQQVNNLVNLCNHKFSDKVALFFGSKCKLRLKDMINAYGKDWYNTYNMCYIDALTGELTNNKIQLKIPGCTLTLDNVYYTESNNKFNLLYTCDLNGETVKYMEIVFDALNMPEPEIYKLSATEEQGLLELLEMQCADDNKYPLLRAIVKYLKEE